MPSSKRAESDDFDDDFDDDDVDDDGDVIVEPDTPDNGRLHRGRDWRDIERYREERELRALIDDDLDPEFDD